jgi:hypothetical protein
MNNKNNSNRTRYNHNQGHNKNRSRQRFAPERLSFNKVYDSNGPTGRQRGNASTLYEKYTTLARDAHSAGDRVLSENFMQYAEHYLRIINSIQEQMHSVYQEASRETESGDSQSYNHETENGDSISELKSDTESSNQIYDSFETNISYSEKTEGFIGDEPSLEKPAQRRKMYPYARRKPYDPNYQHTQNTENTNVSSNLSVQPVVLNNVVDNVVHSQTHMISETTNKTVNSDDTVKPRRVVRRRITKPDTTNNQTEI